MHLYQQLMRNKVLLRRKANQIVRTITTAHATRNYVMLFRITMKHVISRAPDE